MKQISANELSIVPMQDGFALAAGSELLQTDHGNGLGHRSSALLQHIIDEMSAEGPITVEDRRITAPRFFGSLALLSIMVDFVKQGTDEPTQTFVDCLISDPMLQTIAGPEQVSRSNAYAPVKQWLGGDLAMLTSYVGQVQELLAAVGPGNPTPLPNNVRIERILDDIETLYETMTSEQRTVVTFLRNIHGNCLLIPMAAVLDETLTEESYARAVIAALMLDAEQYADMSGGEQQELAALLKRDVHVARSFLTYSSTL